MTDSQLPLKATTDYGSTTWLYDLSEDDGTGDGLVLHVTQMLDETKLPGWTVTARVRRHNGRIVTDRFIVEGPPDVVVGGTAFHVIGRRKMHAHIDEVLRSWSGYLNLPRSWHDNYLSTPRPGRRGRGDIEYAIWCERYVEAFEEQPRSPTKLVVERYAGMTASKLLALLDRAEKRGLIEGRQAGKPGGRLTKKAKEILCDK